MTKTEALEALYERFFDLRNEQANCPAGERASIEAKIAKVRAMIDALENS